MKTIAERYYGYDEICLLPNQCIVNSRSRCSTTVVFGGIEFNLPVVPANMQCVINSDIAEYLSSNYYFYIMHRFNDVDIFDFVLRANTDKWRVISISVGVNANDKKTISRIAKARLRVDFITIDIAHGDAVSANGMISHIRTQFSAQFNRVPFIIAGNVATPSAVENLQKAGADAIKVGISCGKACSTFSQTGFGTPMFTTIMKCAADAKIPIIADGGIRNNGDIAKALVAGATMVMAGSIFAACVDAPGENIYVDRILIAKKYYGSASAENKGNDSYEEGKVVEIPVINGMTYAKKLKKVGESLRSSISYAGGSDLSAFLSVAWAIKSGS